MKSTQWLAALSLACLTLPGSAGCAASAAPTEEDGLEDAELEDDAFEGSQALAAPGPGPTPVLSNWTTVFPTNPNSTPASFSLTDTRVMGGCVFTGIIHQVTFQSWVGIRVSPLLPGSCAITNALGGDGYAHVDTYNGPFANARLHKFRAKKRLVFASSGSGGPSGIATLTMSTLKIVLLDAPSATVLRTAAQSVCASGPGGQILPTTTLTVNPITGTFRVGGTKNAPTGIGIDNPCPQPPSALGYTTFTLRYANFASQLGPVPPPTFSP